MNDIDKSGILRMRLDRTSGLHGNSRMLDMATPLGAATLGTPETRLAAAIIKSAFEDLALYPTPSDQPHVAGQKKGIIYMTPLTPVGE